MPATILGGRLHGPISLSISGKLPVSAEVVQGNIKHAGGLGLPSYPRVAVEAASPHRLAVVGGGASINNHVDALKDWPGEIWAINGALGWCRDRGIAATLFACDPDPIVLKWATGASKALLGNTCDPRVFAMLRDAGADVTLFNADGEKGGIVGRGTTATVAPHLGSRMGYLEGLTFFGCESCYLPGITHAYQHEPRTDELLIECGGNEYLTAPDFYIQAIELSNLIRELPGFLAEESGGLLRAMVKDKEFHVRWVSDALAAGLQPILAGKAQAAA